MKFQRTLVGIAAIALICGLGACSGSSGRQTQTPPPMPMAANQAQRQAPLQMPSRYQNPGYVTSQAALVEDLGATQPELQIRVGATIKSTVGPQPLWDVLKRLANLKGMTVSWASDVDQNFLVDVDINAQDMFQDAVTNLLRQADYFHEIEGNAIVVKNKTTKIFKLGVPYVKGNYAVGVGGNFMPKGGEVSTDIEGIIKLDSKENPYDIWENVQKNLDVILNVAAAERAALAESKAQAAEAAAAAAAAAQKGEDAPVTKAAKPVAVKTADSGKSGQRAEDGGFYIIDKATGQITVTAKPSVMATVENYFANLQKQLYRQIAIEAKIIEVYLNDHSKIGLDWQRIWDGVVGLGIGMGPIYSKTVGGRFVQSVSLTDNTLVGFINALSEQGTTKVLSNPKLTVLNGQPALISVGKVRKYISSIENDVEISGGIRSDDYTVETDSVTEGVSMGVVATIVDDNKIIMQLTPVTSELEPDDAGNPIPYRTVGSAMEFEIGLPVVNMREMSTTVQVNDGEMLVIGGLIDTTTGTQDKGVPVLNKIPVVKYLFGYESKNVQRRELVILLAPKII